ncbi:MAG: ASPIC/UnbV domain-containing protein [Cytophagales bacterium]|nr:ASPIC/UnbV domain-containing protein [Cytophagales bacterium]
MTGIARTSRYIWMALIEGGSSHESQNSTIAHFGMKNAPVADAVIVRWMGGGVQTMYDVAANRLIEVNERLNDSFWQKNTLIIWFIALYFGAFI